MKAYLKNHPIVAALLLLVLTLAAALLSESLNGHHYYYRIYSYGNTVSDVSVESIDEFTDVPTHLIEQTYIEQGEEYTTVYFDAVKSGRGFLRARFSRTTPEGQKTEFWEHSNLLISPMRNIYLSEGIYNQSGFSVIHFAICIYSLLMLLYFIWRRRGLREDTMYSYAYISTWSGQLFFTGIFLVYAITALISLIRYSYVDMFALSAVARYMMLFMTALSFPFVFVFAVSMTISNVSLIRHEGKRFNNMLGILTGLGLICAVFVVLVLFVLFLLNGRENAVIAVLYSSINSIYIIFLCAMYAAIISGLQAGHRTPAMNKDYLIILGCAIRKDGTLFPLIRGRVDRAIEFWKAQEHQTGKRAVFVPSGGQGSDEIISEAEAMKRYLLEQGIPEECIMAETASTTTYENMKFSRELIESINPSAKIAFSTTNYHVMRSGILAAKAGLRAEGMGARTKWYFWPNALLREVVGMFAYQPKVQILTMLLLALLAGGAGYAYYLVM